MAKLEYKLLTIAEGAELGDPDSLDRMEYDTFEATWSHGIYLFEDGVFKKCMSMDGGEPEDNSFVRDGCWITPALNAAYEAGYEAGRNDA